MTGQWRWPWAVVIALGGVGLGCPSGPPGTAAGRAPLNDPAALAPRRSEPILPIFPAAPGHRGKIELGERLFHEPLLSGDGTLSCASCHRLDKGGADPYPTSRGLGGARGPTNTLTVFNSVLNARLFWDARVQTLEEQIDGPLLSPSEMGSSWKEVEARLESSPTYRPRFEKIYPDGVKAANVKDALAAFERTLVTPGSRFDRFLLGEEALNPEQLKGYQLFKNYGCVSCHQGANVGGNFVSQLGVSMVVPGSEAMRVPSLRLVVLTAPYFKDGSVATLEEAVDLMATYQLGVDLPAEDRDLIIQFLHTLPGTYEKGGGPPR